ncbi:MAG TPA: pirin family protein [Egibacteraceae bacterium]|nr:pirin family protein [Egibacteraceae bacterium]
MTGTPTESTTDLIHLTPDDYHVIRPEDFGAPGLVARESIGPFVSLQAVGPLVTVHDSTFEPHSGIGHHPHQRMERLFYILEGAVDHDDALNNITGHMGTGDLGILTEGRRGMIHSERNNTGGRTRCYILVYPTEPLPPTAAFDAIRDAEAPRVDVTPGVTAKYVVQRTTDRLHGDVRELVDSTLEAGAGFQAELGPDESGLVFVLDGSVRAGEDPGAPPASLDREHTLVAPPAPRTRNLKVEARAEARVLHTVMGPGLGLRRRGG